MVLVTHRPCSGSVLAGGEPCATITQGVQMGSQSTANHSRHGEPAKAYGAVISKLSESSYPKEPKPEGTIYTPIFKPNIFH